MKPELLSPISNFEMLAAAIEAGADAVYFGLNELNMRITAKNFSLSDMKKITEICHKNKVKAYLAMNTIVYENELEKIKKLLKEAKKNKIDAVIAWDHSVIKEALKQNLKIHLSTQASVSNSEAALFYKNIGVKRIILARECSLEDIKKIKKKSKIETEVFIHGAMCVSVSGRCFTSQFLFGKSANRGECIQPCRRAYHVKDIEKEFELELENNYIMSAKDLCTIPFIEKLIEAGIDAFKIEGRSRSPEYVKIVTEVYREAIDTYPKINKAKLMKKLRLVYNRGFSSGFFLGKPINEFTDSHGSKAKKKKTYIGIVKNFYKKIKVAEIKLEGSNIKKGDTILIIGPTTGVKEQIITSIQINHKEIKEAKKGQRAGIKLTELARENDKVYLWE